MIINDVINLIYYHCDTPSKMTLNCVAKLFANAVTKTYLRECTPFFIVDGEITDVQHFKYNKNSNRHLVILIDDKLFFPFIKNKLLNNKTAMRIYDCELLSDCNAIAELIQTLHQSHNGRIEPQTQNIVLMFNSYNRLATAQKFLISDLAYNCGHYYINLILLTKCNIPPSIRSACNFVFISNQNSYKYLGKSLCDFKTPQHNKNIFNVTNSYCVWNWEINTICYLKNSDLL